MQVLLPPEHIKLAPIEISEPKEAKTWNLDKNKTKTLLDWVKKSNQTNKIFTEIRNRLVT